MSKLKITKIHRWQGEYEWLNNNYATFIEYGGDRYPSVTHAFLASKTNDQKLRNSIKTAAFKDLPALSDIVGFPKSNNWYPSIIMLELLGIKFGFINQNGSFKEPMRLQKRLIATRGAELIYGNMIHDNHWGQCLCGKDTCPKGEGKNLLGFAIMSFRLKAQERADLLFKSMSGWCFCGDKATNVMLYSVEKELQLKGYCNQDNCIARTKKFLVDIASDELFVNYTPEQPSNILYLPQLKESTSTKSIVIVESDKKKIHEWDGCDECYGYNEMGIFRGAWGYSSNTSSTASEPRKYETLTFKGS